MSRSVIAAVAVLIGILGCGGCQRPAGVASQDAAAFHEQRERDARRADGQSRNDVTSERYGDNSEAGRFAAVNGIRLYYETYGSGPPLLLIHGNGGSIAAMRHQIEHFSTEYRVVVPDWRGSGKTEIGGGLLTYEQIADDLNALLDRLDLRSSYLLGWSDGGVLGLLLAIRHPEKVTKLAIMAARLRPDGEYEWAPACIKGELAQYDRMIAQGDQSRPWQTIRSRTALMLDQPNIPAASLKTVLMPTLVMAGDKDVVRDEHTLEIFHGLPNAHLCIFPGATHRLPIENPSVFNQIAGSFFRAPFRRPDTKDYWVKPTE